MNSTRKDLPRKNLITSSESVSLNLTSLREGSPERLISSKKLDSILSTTQTSMISTKSLSQSLPVTVSSRRQLKENQMLATTQVPTISSPIEIPTRVAENRTEPSAPMFPVVKTQSPIRNFSPSKSKLHSPKLYLAKIAANAEAAAKKARENAESLSNSILLNDTKVEGIKLAFEEAMQKEVQDQMFEEELKRDLEQRLKVEAMREAINSVEQEEDDIDSEEDAITKLNNHDHLIEHHVMDVNPARVFKLEENQKQLVLLSEERQGLLDELARLKIQEAAILKALEENQKRTSNVLMTGASSPIHEPIEHQISEVVQLAQE